MVPDGRRCCWSWAKEGPYNLYLVAEPKGDESGLSTTSFDQSSLLFIVGLWVALGLNSLNHLLKGQRMAMGTKKLDESDERREVVVVLYVNHRSALHNLFALLSIKDGTARWPSL